MFSSLHVTTSFGIFSTLSATEIISLKSFDSEIEKGKDKVKVLFLLSKIDRLIRSTVHERK